MSTVINGINGAVKQLFNLLAINKLHFSELKNGTPSYIDSEINRYKNKHKHQNVNKF